MARLKALKSFAGKISMYAGEVKEVTDEAIVKDLLHAGYVEVVKTQEAKIVEKPVEKKEEKPEKSTKKSTKRRKK